MSAEFSRPTLTVGMGCPSCSGFRFAGSDLSVAYGAGHRARGIPGQVPSLGCLLLGPRGWRQTGSQRGDDAGLPTSGPWGRSVRGIDDIAAKLDSVGDLGLWLG